jgi:hypothetical protein
MDYRWVIPHTLSDGGCELFEELVRKLLGDPVDQPLPELSELAADLSLDVIDQEGAAILVLKSDVGSTLGEPRNPAVSLSGDPVAIGQIEVGIQIFSTSASLSLAQTASRPAGNCT